MLKWIILGVLVALGIGLIAEAFPKLDNWFARNNYGFRHGLLLAAIALAAFYVVRHLTWN